MVDCFDRIAVQMTEIALEPILQLADRNSMASATVCLPSNGRRVLLTVSKRFPNGDGNPPVYAWALGHSDDSEQPTGAIAASPRSKQYPKPEDAFWAAVDALRDANRGRLRAS